MKVGLFAVIVAAVALTSGDALTASNPVPSNRAGFGPSVVSGYAVSEITFAPDPTDPTVLVAVTFRLDSSQVAEVKVRLVSAGGTWLSCSVAAGTATCPAGIPLSAVDTFDVVAHS